MKNAPDLEKTPPSSGVNREEKVRRFCIWFFYVVIVGGGIVYHFNFFPVKN